MSICTSKTPVPFGTLGTAQKEVMIGNTTFYEATLSIKAPTNHNCILEIDSISLHFGAFQKDGGDGSNYLSDPEEFVQFNIVSLGKTVLDRKLNSSEACALFANNARNVRQDVDSLEDVNSWNLTQQGCAITLASAVDKIEVLLRTKMEVEARPLAARGCYRWKQTAGCINRVPLVIVSGSAEIQTQANDIKNAVFKVAASCASKSHREINRIVFPGASRFTDLGDEDNNINITLKSGGLTAFQGKIKAVDLGVLVPTTGIFDDSVKPECALQVWDFSCPLVLKCRDDVVDIVVTDNDVGDETPSSTNQLPIVLLGCEERKLH